jgi:hypothetical protein
VVDKPAYDELAAKVESIRSTTEKGLAFIKNYIRQSIQDQAQAINAMEAFKDWESRITSVLEDLEPGPRGSIESALRRLDELLQPMSDSPERTLGALPDPDRSRIGGVIQACRDQLRDRIQRSARPIDAQ